MVIVSIAITVFVIVNYFSIVSILNSHFGTNLSTQESDNKSKSLKNFISRLYDNEIERFYDNSPFKAYVEPSAVKSIDISELTKEKFISLTNNFTTPLVVKGFLKNSQAVKEWSLDFFSDKYGDIALPTVLNADIKTHESYINNKQSEKYDYVTMKKIVDSIKNGEKMYVNNVSRIFGYHPELLDYLELEK